MAVYLMAHDLGTTGNKATLFSVDGTLVAHTVYPYPTRYFNSTWAEQDPRNWWKAVCETSRRLLEQVPAGDIAAVAFSGQMMGCVCLGKHGELLRDGIILSLIHISQFYQKEEPVPFGKTALFFITV